MTKRERLEYLKTVKRKELTEMIQVAQKIGLESPEYKTAIEMQGNNEVEIFHLEEELKDELKNEKYINLQELSEKDLCEKLDKMAEKYKPILDKIFSEDKKYFQNIDDVVYDFIYDGHFNVWGRPSLMARLFPSKRELGLNIIFVDFMYENKEPLYVEYILLGNMITLSKMDTKDSKSFLKTNHNNKSAEEIAYPYAIMKYKYGDVPYIYIPESMRTEEVTSLVEKYLETFRTNK